MAYKYNPKRKTDPRRYRLELKFPEWLPKRTDGLCSCGCGRPVNRGKVWHLQTCCTAKVQEFQILKGNTVEIRKAVFQRDRGICAGCRMDTNREAESCALWKWDAPVADRVAANAAREKFMLAGFPSPQGHRVYGLENKPVTVHGWNWWQADHIKPVVEGGAHRLENFRTMCIVCHKRETRLLAARRSKAERGLEDTFCFPFARLTEEVP